MLKTLAGLLDFGTGHREQTTFYVCCHSVGRNAASKFLDLHRNAIQVVCSSSYYHKFYVAHKDVALPKSGLAYQRQIGFLSMTGTPHRVFFSLNFDQNHHLDSLNVDQNRNLDQGSRCEFC
jgi:hypothetical protein